MGIAEFYPLLTEHTEGESLRKRERMEIILKEAAEQSERGQIPILGPELSLKDILHSGWPVGLEATQTLMAHSTRESISTLSELLKKTPLQMSASLNLLIGPEGGFSSSEIRQAQENGTKLLRMSDEILKTDTAFILAVGLFRLMYS